MNELEINADSVNFLMTKLCNSLLRQEDSLNERNSGEVVKLKSRAYEILLKKSKRPHIFSETDDVEHFDPQRALEQQLFAAKLNARTHHRHYPDFSAFEEQLQAIEHEEYFQKGPGHGVLQFLLALQGNFYDMEIHGEDGEVGDISMEPHNSELLVPGPFTLFANYQNNRYYPMNAQESLINSTPRYFKGLQPITKYSDNPYLPKFLFNGSDNNKLAAIEQKLATTQSMRQDNVTKDSTESCTFTGMAKRLCGAGAGLRINARAFRLFSECSPESSNENIQQPQVKPFSIKLPTTTQPIARVTIKAIQPPPTPPPEAAASKEVEEDATEQRHRVFSWNWESLGEFGIPYEKPFATDANVTLHLKSYHNKMMGQEFIAKVLTLEQFLKDLKSLTVGIQSDTFHHDEYIVFSMESNITVDGLLPGTIANYVENFLECGTCYKRLQTMIMKRDYKLMFEGFIFKALCSAIDEYLLTFRQYVFAKDDQYLLAFAKRMKNVIILLSNLSYTLAIHPNVDANVKPPMGSQFLGYLYREIVRLTEKDYITLLIFILKRCCHVYFKHLQKWIFYGVLDDPSNELFICFVDHYRQNTKYYYDKAYYVRKESVPGFFQNFEDQILQCGKYTMLLKAYKPNHPLFELECPSISVCLSFDEIEKLEQNCCKYYERARELCGKPITIRDVFDARAEQKRNFLHMVSQRSRENMERWLDEQQAIAAMINEQKRKRLAELTHQLEDAKQRKVAERRANVELELKILREAERLEDQRLARQNINLRKRIEYYQELQDLMQEEQQKKEQAKKATRRLQLQIPDDDEADAASATSTHPPQTPHTPASTTGTDYESCFGDDDDDDEYAECISHDFLQKFQESETTLQALCDNTLSESHLTDINTITAVAPATTPSSPTTKLSGTSLKRSTSDIINSNELPTLVMSILQKRRQEELAGDSVRGCVQRFTDSDTRGTEGVRNINMMLPPPSLRPPAIKVTTDSPTLSEAQRNRMKVLTQEFGCYTDEVAPLCTTDINLNTLPDDQLTDLQRNRRHMMQNDLFSEYNKDPMAERAHLQLNLNSDLARNRRKVLESEYHILTGVKTDVTPSTTTFTVESVAAATTPMSTTSDATPITEEALVIGMPHNNNNNNNNNNHHHRSDVENGNVSQSNTTTSTPLKLDIKLANEQHKEDAPALDLQGTTPDYALNTAGIMAKQGFPFHDEEKLQRQQRAAATEVPIQNGNDDVTDATNEINALYTQCDYSQPYKRCVELIESNFKCEPKSPYFRLNKPSKEAATNQRESSNRAEEQQCPKNKHLNSISIITLTEFLQKSIIIPMNTHLELVNNEVMRMFLEDLHLFEHLRSLRNYFFLMDGEFGSIICDGLIGKLEMGATPEKLLNYQMLHSILDTALGSSITGSDKNADNLSFIVADVPEKFDLTSPSVLNNLSLSYRIAWPLNLILNPETIDQYANIFKYLIKVRRISWILERAYQMLKEAVKKNGTNLLKSPQYHHVQQIRHKFYHFVHALQHHITANALQASWKTFKDELLNAKSIEDIYRRHTTYVKRILFLCMLNRRSTEFYNTIENVFKISLRFYNNLKMREFKIHSGDEHYTHSRYDKMSNDEIEFDKFIKYTIYLGNKIVRHGYQAEIGEFINLINYNYYYMAKNGT